MPNKKIKYKYLIHYHLNQLPHEKYKITSQQLPKKIGISTETFRKWKYIQLDSDATIPADKLAIIAFFFDIRIEEIFNYPIPKLNFSELEEAYLAHKLQNL